MIERSRLEECHICPRDCGVNRYQSTGFCGASAELKINLAQLHYGEEPPISGTGGSGTIFFSHCNLLCVYCQNHQISQEGCGNHISEEDLAALMLKLQESGAHNVNLVTPTHYSLQIAESIRKAKSIGLSIPVLWNSSAYEKPEILRELEGLVDIYLPDCKYFHKVYARKYSHAADYPEQAMKAIREMYRQCGNLQLNAQGIAQKGVIVRLLVLPRELAGVRQSLIALAEEFGTELAISLMAQYYPAGQADRYPELGRGISAEEYQKVLDTAVGCGFDNVFVQQLSSDDHWTPKFWQDSSGNPISVIQGVKT